MAGLSLPSFLSVCLSVCLSVFPCLLSFVSFSLSVFRFFRFVCRAVVPRAALRPDPGNAVLCVVALGRGYTRSPLLCVGLSRRGRSGLASASDVGTHRDSMTGRFGRSGAVAAEPASDGVAGACHCSASLD